MAVGAVSSLSWPHLISVKLDRHSHLSDSMSDKILTVRAFLEQNLILYKILIV